MTDEQLQAIKERCNKATRGPWEKYAEYNNRYFTIYSGKLPLYDPVVLAAFIEEEDDDFQCYGVLGAEDADFIAHSREDVPALLSEIDILNEMVDILTGEDMTTCPLLGLYSCRMGYKHASECKYTDWNHINDCWKYAARKEAEKNLKAQEIKND